MQSAETVMVPVARLELARGFPLRILSPVCLPIPSHRRATLGQSRGGIIQPSIRFKSNQFELFAWTRATSEPKPKSIAVRPMLIPVFVATSAKMRWLLKGV